LFFASIVRSKEKGATDYTYTISQVHRGVKEIIDNIVLDGLSITKTDAESKTPDRVQLYRFDNKDVTAKGLEQILKIQKGEGGEGEDKIISEGADNYELVVRVKSGKGSVLGYLPFKSGDGNDDPPDKGDEKTNCPEHPGGGDDVPAEDEDEDKDEGEDGEDTDGGGGGGDGDGGVLAGDEGDEGGGGGGEVGGECDEETETKNG